MAWKNVQYENGKMRTSEGGGGGGSSTFADLDDVSFNNLQNGQVPKYNSTTQKWENADESGGGGTVTDVTVDGTSVVNQQGVAEITMPTPPTIPVQDVEVNGTSVVNQQGVAEITMPTPPTIPVTDVKVNGTSVVDGNKEAQIKSYKEVTQAEYNALPASKTSDGILYCIKDAGGADGFPPLIYSLEEREVGVWTDGKPLYEVTKIYNNLHIRGTEQLLDSGLLSVDSFVGATGSWIRSDDTCNNLPSSHTSGSFCVTANDFDRTTGKINLVVGSFNNYFYLESCIITFRYTKTTDTAGSGTWTTQSGYAHHYSTTEKVVGTWIDGKPLYEKTIELNTSSLVGGQWAFIPTGLASSTQLKKYNIYFIYNSNLYEFPYNEGSWCLYGAYQSASQQFAFYMNGFSGISAYMIAQYTKTTD